MMKNVWRILFLYFKEFTVASVERLDWAGKVRTNAGNIFVRIRSGPGERC